MPNYLKHYEQLCSTRKLLCRSKSDGVYYEKHHIIPKSLGGINDTVSTCPYCNKTGQTNVMKRWHFNNCKKVSDAQLA